MGNRAVITTRKDLTDIGVYLHWNGGRDSIEGFLCYCKMKGYPSPELDIDSWKKLAEVADNFLCQKHSCNLAIAEDLDFDNFDNGTFVIKDWLIVGRRFVRHSEQLEYDLREFVAVVNDRQPYAYKLDREEWARFDAVRDEILKARDTNTVEYSEID